MTGVPLTDRVRGTAWRAAFWACVVSVSYLALAPQYLVIDPGGSDKTHHVVAFATLGLLGSAAWPVSMGRVLLGLLAYGCLIEVLQGFTATRVAEVLDVVADAVGLGIAAVLPKLAGRLWSAFGRSGSR